jgi:cytochrome c oxidase subunit 2
MSGRPQNLVPRALSDIGIDQRLDHQVPLDIGFLDEQGRAVRFGDYFGKRPVVLALVYYSCPMLCNQVLTGLVGSLKGVAFDAGKEFDVVTVSFDPRETPEQARASKDEYVARYGRAGAASGWRALTGDEASIKALTEAVGFRYAWDEETKQYAHASGIILITAEGKLSRYFYGIDYAPKDVRLGLVEASANKIGSPVDQLLLYCYDYDPSTGKYGAVIMNMIRLAGLATFLGVVALIIIMRRREARRLSEAGEGGPYELPRDERHAPTQFGLLPVALIPFFPEQASTVAGEVDALYIFLWTLTIVMSLLITLGLIYFVLKYRRRAPDEIPRPVEGSMKLEMIWIIIPFLVVMVIFVWGAKVYFSMTRQPSEALEIYVIGKQWMWKFQHPDGQREINELHVPIGRNVRLTMGTEDVIHSFFVPDFRVKQDVVPGRYTKLWFRPTKPGRYRLFCAEYCGTQHSGMIGWVVVLEPKDYQAWLSGGNVEGSLASTGQKLFQDQACHTCHRSDGQGRGPVLDNLFGKQVELADGTTVIADENYIRESIVNPRARIVAGFSPIMPTFQGRLSEEQLLQLIAYIRSLGAQQTPGAAPPPGGPTENRTPGLSPEGGTSPGATAPPAQRRDTRQ